MLATYGSNILKCHRMSHSWIVVGIEGWLRHMSISPYISSGIASDIAFLFLF